MDMEEIIHEKFVKLQPFLNEKQLRLYAASEAVSIGYGGISIVSRSTGISRRAITQGCKELKLPMTEDEIIRIRKKGAGRKKLSSIHPKLKQSLEGLISPVTRGDPESPLKWTSKSVRHLSEALRKLHYDVSHQTISALLIEMGWVH